MVKRIRYLNSSIGMIYVSENFTEIFEVGVCFSIVIPLEEESYST